MRKITQFNSIDYLQEMGNTLHWPIQPIIPIRVVILWLMWVIRPYKHLYRTILGSNYFSFVILSSDIRIMLVTYTMNLMKDNKVAVHSLRNFLCLLTLLLVCFNCQ